MQLLDRNPFSNIKANDLNDCEIIEQWVEMPGTDYKELMNPKSLDPLFILGGKGSGKTHLMRYCSFESQSLRCKGSISDTLLEDLYLGIYYRASGLNSSRFDDLPIDEKIKHKVFEYSFEIFVGVLFIQTLLDIEKQDNKLSFNENYDFVLKVKKLFLDRDSALDECDSLTDIKAYLESLSKKIDIKVNNYFFSGDLGININLNRGSLIFGLPQCVLDCYSKFENLSFIYLIDELENFSQNHQKYINTLLRERKSNVTFRIGARLNGIYTFQTLSAGEYNREGHEYYVSRLDKLFIEKESYEVFSLDLILKRLVKFGFIDESDLSILSKSDKLSLLRSLFEVPEYLESGLFLNKGVKSPQIVQLRSKILSVSAINEPQADSICELLSYPEDLILEKVAIHIFSQEWSKQAVSTEELINIAEETHRVVRSTEAEDIKEVKTKTSKYKNNYIASILRGKHQSNFDQYLGFDEILKITKGYPRHIITVFRHLFKNEVFNNGFPFTRGHKISLSTQRISLKESFEWFHGDCVSEGKLGHNVEVALSRLAELLRIETYADKPVECSASGFDVDLNRISDDAKSVLKWAEMIRVLIPAGSPRQDKNSQALNAKYYINGLLCPRWGIPASRRGSLSLSTKNFNFIFEVSREDEYKVLYKEFDSSRNTPYEVVANDKEQMEFDL